MPSDSAAIRRWLLDIQHHIHLAQGFTAGLNAETFSNDTLRVYAVTRCLEIISEASRRLPDDFKGRHPSIAWRDMAAAGNIYRHEYEDVAANRVWQTITHSLPALLDIAEDELSKSGEDGEGWVALRLELKDDTERKLEEHARNAGLSLKCYCLRVLMKHLLESAAPDQRKRWLQDMPATFRRNGCTGHVEL